MDEEANEKENKIKAIDELSHFFDNTSEEKLKAFDRILSEKVSLVAHRCNLKDEADLLIASNCIVNDYVLITNNFKHFQTIHSLKCKNWLHE